MSTSMIHSPVVHWCKSRSTWVILNVDDGSEEARTIWKGVNVCKTAGMLKVTVEYYSMLIINLFNGKLKVPWQISQTIDKIIREISYSDFIFYHVKREENFTADRTTTTTS
ncbi:hypothetical protein RDI58_000796 [Solanum bulbocastanum]|uniref:RNase H type-1 domain-containing protein n=1 Tax=Solanum bulbocastanum TaxID=147425 RepID=A0AAN8YSQ1_SOLBU